MQFAERNELTVNKWFKETVSGKVKSQDRKLSTLLQSMDCGDTLIITEISRLSRTLLDIMEILNICIQKGIVLYSTKEGYVFKDDINSKVLGFAFGLVAEIERNLISIRTKEALAQRKQEGQILGRKKGDEPKKEYLRNNQEMIRSRLNEGATRKLLAKEMGVSISTMNRYVKNELIRRRVC